MLDYISYIFFFCPTFGVQFKRQCGVIDKGTAQGGSWELGAFSTYPYNPAPIPLRGDCPKGEPRPAGGSLRRVDRKNKKSAAICSDPAHRGRRPVGAGRICVVIIPFSSGEGTLAIKSGSRADGWSVRLSGMISLGRVRCSARCSRRRRGDRVWARFRPSDGASQGRCRRARPLPW